jgi:lipopolysaccharide/colanic/teichoic acid biosynthesis glycosyltransferase
MKRLFDLAVATLLLVLLAPLFVVIALLIRVFLGSPILYRQTRPGKQGQPFQISKFRTMRKAVNAKGISLPDVDRLTRFGKVLRSTSLDELPELINVIRGEMSLVGPRPLLMEYLQYYTEEENRRHEVRPGITGWAQVNGRNALTWEEKFSLDVWYVDHQSLWLDLKILFMTVGKVIARDGVSAEGHVTMPPFRRDVCTDD